MSNYVKTLADNPNGVFSTIDGQKPAGRIFQILWTEENRIYFCTSNEKDVYQQIKANPNVSFTTWDPNKFEAVTVNGKVVFTDDIKLKTRALDENPSIKGIYGEPTNPAFEVFYLDIDSGNTFDFNEGTRKINI